MDDAAGDELVGVSHDALGAAAGRGEFFRTDYFVSARNESVVTPIALANLWTVSHVGSESPESSL